VATWSGWQAQFLRRAGIIVTPPNQNLLTEWSKHTTTNCRNNPIDLSHKLSGSTNCGKLPGIFPQAQRYTNHDQAANAFKAEIHADFAQQLLRALNTGSPFQVAYFNDVASVFVSWGSPDFLDVYLADAGGKGGGSGGGGGKASRAHGGWKDLQRSINHRMPAALQSSKRSTAAALRSLSHARKVRL